LAKAEGEHNGVTDDARVPATTDHS